MRDWLADLPEPEIEASIGEWEQPPLFGARKELPLAEGVQGRDYGLRWYQQEAKACIEAALAEGESTLIVKATGTGKTRTFGAVAGDWQDGDVLILAHRDELVHQARRDLEKITGETVEVEQGDLRASNKARLVVGSIDTVKRQNRLDRMGKDRWGLIICDEAHHYVAKTYRKALEFFSAKRLGVTATPDRGDMKALGQVFKSVSYIFDIQQGIEQGYLVPVHQHEVTLGEIDISGVGVSGGDLVAAQLDDAMLKAMGGIVSETLKYEPDRQGVVFLPGVKTAELAAQLFNKAIPGCAAFVSGTTPKDERRGIIEDFRAGRYKYLANCMIATEGFDAPSASLIVQGRPTKSRALYAQMAGRATRVLPGVVDHLHGRDAAEARRGAVAGSGKPDCMILDFVGNSGKHKLVTAADVLGGKYTDDEIKVAKEKLKTGGNVAEALAKARLELQRIASAAQVKASSVRRQVDPFGAFNMTRNDQVDLRFGYRAMTKGQRDFLVKAGVKEKELEGMSKADALRLQGAIAIRRQKGLASYGQMRTLKMVGVTDPNVPFRKAKEALDYVFSCWNAKPALKADPARVDAIIHRTRMPGEEG